MAHSCEAILLELQECLCTRISEQALLGEAKPVCICTVVAGDSVPLDYCGSCDDDACGIAWTRLVNVSPPMEAFHEGRHCDQPVQATFEAGIARCSITDMSDPDGPLPTADMHLQEVLQQMDDLKILRYVATCCIKGAALESYEPFGPEGGCYGGIATFTVNVLH